MGFLSLDVKTQQLSRFVHIFGGKDLVVTMYVAVLLYVVLQVLLSVGHCIITMCLIYLRSSTLYALDIF